MYLLFIIIVRISHNDNLYKCLDESLWGSPFVQEAHLKKNYKKA